MSRAINRTRRTPGKSIWLRNYYEHIIRNEEALNQIRLYIHHNPAGWAEDENHPNKLQA